MSRRTDHLERLCNKLEYRFGKTDALFVQAKTELEAYQSYVQLAPLRHDWSKPYDSVIKTWAATGLPHARH